MSSRRAPHANEPDRSRPPAAGPAPRWELPQLERGRTPNGVRVAATRSDATPELLLELSLPSGRVCEPLGREGLASLTALMLQEGTRKLTTVEVSDAFDFLGASFEVRSGDDETTLYLRVLEDKAAPALELLADILLTPRFGAREFERVREQRRAALRSRADDPNAVAHDVWTRLYWGRSTSLGSASIGDAESLKATTLADVLAFHVAGLRPRSWRCSVVCRSGLEQALELLAPLEARLGGLEDARAAGTASGVWSMPTPLARGRTRVHLVDRPGAPQSELRVGHPSVPSSHPAWLPLTALNQALGGVFTSRLNLNLRESKGYTYGVRSSFDGGRRPGPFLVSTSVHTQNTAAALREIERELEGFLAGPTPAEVAFVRSALEQSLARQFETPQARLAYVGTVERYGLRDDYPLQRLEWLARAGAAEMAGLLAEHLRPQELTVVVVGDHAATAKGLAELGHGAPVRVDASGDELKR
jgi:zinc protease